MFAARHPSLLGTMPTQLQSCPFFSFLTHTPGKEGWNCGQSYSTILSYLGIWIMREGSGTKGFWSWVIVDSPWWSFMNSCWWSLGHILLFTLSFDNRETSIFFHYHPLFIFFSHLARFDFYFLQRNPFDKERGMQANGSSEIAYSQLIVGKMGLNRGLQNICKSWVG